MQNIPKQSYVLKIILTALKASLKLSLKAEIWVLKPKQAGRKLLDLLIIQQLVLV